MIIADTHYYKLDLNWWHDQNCWHLTRIVDMWSELLTSDWNHWHVIRTVDIWLESLTCDQNCWHLTGIVDMWSELLTSDWNRWHVRVVIRATIRWSDTTVVSTWLAPLHLTGAEWIYTWLELSGSTPDWSWVDRELFVSQHWHHSAHHAQTLRSHSYLHRGHIPICTEVTFPTAQRSHSQLHRGHTPICTEVTFPYAQRSHSQLHRGHIPNCTEVVFQTV